MGRSKCLPNLPKTVCSFRFHALKFIVVIALLSACIKSSPEPAGPLPLVTEPLHDEGGGYSIRYPTGWKAELRSYGSVFIDEQTQPSGRAPRLEIQHITFSENSVRGWTGLPPSDAWNMLEPIWEAGFADEGAKIVEKAESVMIAGYPAAYIEYGYFFSSETAQEGRIICIFLDDRGLFIQGGARSDLWQEFLPTLELMLDSLTIFEPQP